MGVSSYYCRDDTTSGQIRGNGSTPGGGEQLQWNAPAIRQDLTRHSQIAIVEFGRGVYNFVSELPASDRGFVHACHLLPIDRNAPGVIRDPV